MCKFGCNGSNVIILLLGIMDGIGGLFLSHVFLLQWITIFPGAAAAVTALMWYKRGRNRSVSVVDWLR